MLVFFAVVVLVTVISYFFTPIFFPNSVTVLGIAAAASVFYIIYLVFEALQTSRKRTDVTAFVLHVLLSAVLVIFVCAGVYQQTGLKEDMAPGAGLALYFSAVAFSTLGFGDFAPAGGLSRGVAATEALIGNLHLALIAASAFFLLTRPLDVVEDGQPLDDAEGGRPDTDNEVDAMQMLSQIDDVIAAKREKVTELSEAIERMKAEQVEIETAIKDAGEKTNAQTRLADEGP
ncbi:MAG: ion channel [Pseudomonadota bacterium]